MMTGRRITELLSVTVVAVSLVAGTARGEGGVVSVTGITGHNGGNWPDWAGHLTDAVNALNPLSPGDVATTGMDTSIDPEDPATWTWSGGYGNTWHANSILVSSNSANNKIGWVVMDFVALSLT